MDHTPHYFVKVATKLPSEEWFRVVARFKADMTAHGFRVDEFGDTTEVDREAVRRQGGSDTFEGQVVFPSSKEWEVQIPKFFEAEGLDIVELALDD